MASGFASRIPDPRVESGHSRSEGDTLGGWLRSPLKLRSVAFGLMPLCFVTASFFLQLLPHVDYFLRIQRNLWLSALPSEAAPCALLIQTQLTLCSFAFGAAQLALGTNYR